MTEYQHQRKLLRDYLSRQRRKGISVKTKLPKYVKNPTEKSVERLKQARESAKAQAKTAREKIKKTHAKTPTIRKPEYKTPTSDISRQFPEQIYHGYEPDHITEPEIEIPSEKEPETYIDETTGLEYKHENVHDYEKIYTDEGNFIVDLDTGEVVQANIDNHYVIFNESIVDHILKTYAYSQFEGNFSPNKVALQGFFDNLVNEFGKDTVAQALLDASKDGVQITRVILYSGEEAESYMSNIMDYIDEAGQMKKEEYLDLFGNVEDWNTAEDRELFESRYRG